MDLLDVVALSKKLEMCQDRETCDTSKLYTQRKIGSGGVGGRNAEF
jgi:hypothetical protein